MTNAKTYSQKPKEVTRKWYVLDASEAPMGRLATVAARLLIGKDKPSVTPHIDGGDYVIIINCQKLVTTGNKAQKKTYYRHSGYPGGIKASKLSDISQEAPEAALRHAIWGMLPVNKLRAGRLERLKLYSGSEQPHAGQNPRVISMSKRSQNGR